MREGGREEGVVPLEAAHLEGAKQINLRRGGEGGLEGGSRRSRREGVE